MRGPGHTRLCGNGPWPGLARKKENTSSFLCLSQPLLVLPRAWPRQPQLCSLHSRLHFCTFHMADRPPDSSVPPSDGSAWVTRGKAPPRCMAGCPPAPQPGRAHACLWGFGWSANMRRGCSHHRRSLKSPPVKGVRGNFEDYCIFCKRPAVLETTDNQGPEPLVPPWWTWHETQGN